MCGRFTVAMDFEELQEAFPGVDFGLYLKPNYNVAPSQDVLVISGFEPKKALPFRWGLIPPWSKDIKIGYKMINARAETLHEKTSFKKPFRSQRCLIPTNGFFEWKKEGSHKIPMYIQLKSKKTFAFAGLWEKWMPEDQQPVYSFTIITTAANQLLQSVHQRMPVILKPEDYPLWLNTDIQDNSQLSDLLAPYDPDSMTYHPVSTLVNSPKNNHPDCVKKIVA